MVRVLYDSDENVACLYDSVTEIVFGRVFHDIGEDKEIVFACDVADTFLKRLDKDARSYEIDELIALQGDFVRVMTQNIM